MSIKDELDISDIFRIRFPNTKRFTFRQKLRTRETIHRRLDYIFIANTLQEFAKSVEVLPSLLSDHSPVLLSLNESKENDRGKGLWKFNNSLLEDENFKKDLRKLIQTSFEKLSKSEFSPHFIWEMIKYEIRKFCIKHSKINSKIKRENKLQHEIVVQNFESNPEGQNVSTTQYDDSKYWLEKYYDEKLRGIILRSKSDCYEKGEKSTKYFLNLEKKNGIKNTIRNLFIKNEQNETIETDNESKIIHHAHTFYSSL
ncbi:MAG: hypothetical protein HRT69_18820, partial [Flavobacteriaceae bacterium]|nr:hypothetical protein [Flavobacteriaceae bacterium]